MVDIAPELQKPLRKVLENTRIESISEFRFGDGSVIRVSTASPDRDEGASPEALVEAIWPYLYQNFYAVSGTCPLETPIKQSVSEPAFKARLSAANVGSPSWHSMWKVNEIRPDGTVFLQKGDSYRVGLPGQYAFLRASNRLPRHGEWVDLLVPKELHEAEQGFYYVFGATPGCGFDDADLVRIYCHVRAQSVPDFIRTVASRLNWLGVPFGLKCLPDPSHYDRSDSMVLYVAKRYLTITLRQILSHRDSLKAYFEAGTPRFTKELELGLGIADDPGVGMSFGQNCCRLLAQGIVQAWLAGATDHESKLAALVTAFAQKGINLTQPYLRPGTVDQFRQEDELPISEQWNSVMNGVPPPTIPDRQVPPFLDTAERIAGRLCRDALWSEGRCNWMTWSMESFGGPPVLVYRSAPVRLYDGLAGIALFLGQVAHLTADRELWRIVQGATRQIRAMITDASEVDWGYFTGLAGIGHAILQIGEMAREPALVREGLELVARCCGREVGPANLDYFSGCAGIIPLLLDLGKRYGRSSFIEAASNYTEALLEHSVEEEGTISWPSAYARSANLVSLADGTTGIILALANALATNPSARLREVIIKALWYERKAYDPAQRNWQDYRQILSDSEVQPPFPISCSHGAGGIALSRLRLLQLFGHDAAIEQDLELAIATTRQAVVEPLAADGENFSLFHGRAGNASVLLAAAKQLNRPQLHDTAKDLGRIGIDAYERHRLPWPSGLPEEKEALGLMTGVAGIGSLYLNLHGADFASPPFPV